MPPQVRNRKTDNRRFLRVKTILWARYGDPQAAMVVFADNSALSSMGRGIVLARQNDVARARNEFERALERDPNDSLILREAGAFHYRKGDLRVSLDLLTRALKINPNDYMASFYYARLMEEYGEYDRAIENFRDVLRRVPEESEVHRAYAQTLNKTRKEALAYIHMTYGALYDGDKKKTEQYLKRAKALAKTPAEQQSLTRLTNRVEEYKKLWKN